MRARVCSGCLLIGLLLWSGLANAQVDWSEYDVLWQAVVEGHQTVAEADEDDAPALIDAAIERDTNFLMWIEAVVETDDFGALPEDRQLSLVNAQNRAQFLRARLLLAKGECASAREDIEAIGWRPNVDEELRQALDEQLAEIVRCVPPVRIATLRIECTPMDAEVWIDGEMAGLAEGAHDVEVGEHHVTLRAAGFRDYEFTFDAGMEGEPIQHGPVAMELFEPEVTEPVEATSEAAQEPEEPDRGIGLHEVAPAPSDGPGAAPFVLLGTGAALAIGGLLYDFAITADTRDEFEAIQAECENGCTEDRHSRGEDLRDDLGTAKIVDGLLYGGAFVAVTVAVILLFTGGDGGSDVPVAIAPSIGPQGFGGVLTVGF